MKHLFLIVALTVCVCPLFGCGESIEAENDTDLLEPAWDFQLRELNIDPGSLIRPEDVPVVSIEITRQDAENVWWRLTANPASTHEDLVVGVYYHSDGSHYERYVIPKNQNHSMEYQQPRPPAGEWEWVEEPYVSTYWERESSFNGFYYVFAPDINMDIWVMTENVEYKRIQEVARIGVERGGIYVPHQGADPPRGQWAWFWTREGYRRYVFYWSFSNNYDYTVDVQGTGRTLDSLWRELGGYIDAGSGWGAGDLPPFITDDGYAVPHGFRFTYYHTSPQDEIVIPILEESPEKPNTLPE